MSVLNAALANKSSATVGPSSSSPAVTGISNGSEAYGQKRSGGSGSFGAGASSRNASLPRKSQALRKSHKSSRRFRLEDEDVLAESAAMRSTNNRRGQTSITHLMTFTLPPRPQNRPSRYSHASRRHAAGGLGSGYHAVDKARYVHANNRFVVDPRADYKAQSEDADVHLDWKDVLQIIVSPQSQLILSAQTQPLVSSESRLVVCPICLQAPVAPRMTGCGHIFCLPCLVAYLSLHMDEEVHSLPERRPRWKKCPVCGDSVYLHEARPVRWYISPYDQMPLQGEDVILRLIRRPVGSTLALPKEAALRLPAGDFVPAHFAPEAMDYARVMTGSDGYMKAQFDGEIAAVQAREREDEAMYGDGDEWTRKAVRLIVEAQDRLCRMADLPESGLTRDDVRSKRPSLAASQSTEDMPDMHQLQTELHLADSHTSSPARAVDESHKPPSEGRTGTRPSLSALLPTSISRQLNRSAPDRSTSDYYFYQALPNYYLAPLDIRILKAAFSDFAAFPTTILPKVEHVSFGHQVDEAFRKRVKYLGHLPCGSEVNFLECSWTDTVEQHVIDRFQPEIEQRRRKNQEKEVREEKERLRAEKEEDERYAASRRKRRSPSVDQFSSLDFQPLRPVVVDDADDAELHAAHSPWPPRQAGDAGFTSLASLSTSPSTARTVWGTVAIRPGSPRAPEPVADEHDAPDDGWFNGWDDDGLLEVALAQQLHLDPVEGGSSRLAPAADGRSKKKSKKKITLMSTNARRGA